MNKVLRLFLNQNTVQAIEKETIVQRLLNNNHITAHEAILLLKFDDVKINIEKIEMSSGAKIVYGNDYETNNR